MKKTLIAFVMSVIMIGFASCGGGSNKHSKAFNESKKVLDNVLESVNKAKDCDDLDMAAFGILGLLAVEGIDAMPQADEEELNELTTKIDKALEEKKAELNCQDDNFFDDEDLPMDEPVEEEE